VNAPVPAVEILFLHQLQKLPPVAVPPSQKINYKIEEAISKAGCPIVTELDLEEQLSVTVTV
jgi:hypothetical protein